MKDIPALNEGESYRKCYSRLLGHWSKYTTASGEGNPSCGTTQCLIMVDLLAPTEVNLTTSSRIHSLTTSQSWQTLTESYQSQVKVKVLNSKIDFNQPLRSLLTVISKASNIAPGRPDQTKPSKPLPILQLKYNPPTTTTPTLPPYPTQYLTPFWENKTNLKMFT